MFRLNTISDDTDKFDLIVISLDEDVILDIEDLVAAPPQQDRYETLKARLLKKYAQTTEKKIQRLLQAKEMTGMKPTEMLAHMRRLAPSSLEPVIRSIFLQNIPSSIRPLLSAWPEDDLDNLAEVADKMLDAAKMDDVHISQQSMQLPAGSLLDLGLRRSFCWSFIVADVPIAIIGADFLAKHNLLIDLKAQQLIDTATKVSVTGSSCKVETPSVSTINEDQNYHTLLGQGQDTSKSDDHGTTRVPHDVVHHIETTGNPVADRPRRLSGEKLSVAKAEHPGLLQQQPALLQHHPAVIQQHSAVFQQHFAVFQQHSAVFQQHPAVFQQHPAVLQQYPAAPVTAPSGAAAASGATAPAAAAPANMPWQ
ncbi:hypothetical protein ACLKA7_004990 [Drosophila subpalustris]